MNIKTIICAGVLAAAAALGTTACGSSGGSAQPMTPVSVAKNLIGSAITSGPKAGQEVVNACPATSSIVTPSSGLPGIGAYLQFTDGTIQYANVAINPDGSTSWAAVPDALWEGYPNPPQGWSTGNCATGKQPAPSQTDTQPAPAGTQPAPTEPAAPTDTQAAPASTQSITPAPASVKPVFDCYVNQNPPTGDQLYGASINIHPGTGLGYSKAVVKVTIFDNHGRALQTKTITASSASETWQVILYPNGDPSSLATESSCTAVVESAS